MTSNLREGQSRSDQLPLQQTQETLRSGPKMTPEQRCFAHACSAHSTLPGRDQIDNLPCRRDVPHFFSEDPHLPKGHFQGFGHQPGKNEEFSQVQSQIPQMQLQQSTQDHENNCRALEKNYDTAEKRLASFKTYPLNAIAKPRDLADNGLYYTGQGDKVKCAYCRGMLYNWEEDDSPLEEHKKHFPDCEFIKLRYKRLKEMPKDNCRPPSMISNSPPQQNSRISRPLVSGNQPDKKQVVDIVKRMGYDDEIVEKAYNVLICKGQHVVKSAALLDIVFELEDDLEKYSDLLANFKSTASDSSVDMGYQSNSEPDTNASSQPTITSGTAQFSSATLLLSQTSSAHKKHAHLASGNMYETDSPSPKSGIAKAPTDPTRLKELQDEQKKLKQNVICNICRQTKINILFLPCRHLVACEECSADINDCSRCSKKIIGTVKIFMP